MQVSTKYLQNSVLQAYDNTEICNCQYVFQLFGNRGNIMDTYSVIKQLCDEKGIKLSKLSAEIGIRSSVFTELKMGRTKKLSIVTLQKIAAFFEVPIGLLTDEGDAVESMQDELFRKRKLLFDLSAKASSEDLDKLIKIVDALTEE